MIQIRFIFYSIFIVFYFLEIIEFQTNSDEFIEIIDQIANEVEKEKMKTIGTRNLLRSIEKERDAQKQQIQVVSKLKYFTEYYLSYF